MGLHLGPVGDKGARRRKAVALSGGSFARDCPYPLPYGDLEEVPQEAAPRVDWLLSVGLLKA